MKWMLAPLSRHADDGFGATAMAFRKAAERLLAEPPSVEHRELPICFLLRHATELFLKSSLVVLHRRLSRDTKHKDPLVQIGKNRKPLTCVHGIKALFTELGALLWKHRDDLERISKTRWLPFPDGLASAIDLVDGIDASSTFFRYPTGVAKGEEAKSQFKPISLDDLQKWTKQDQGYLKTFLVLDENDEVVEAFHYSPGSLSGEIAALQTACEWLSPLHVGLRMELADGW